MGSKNIYRPPHQNILKDNGVVFEKLLPLIIFNTNNNFLFFCGWGSKVKFLNTNPLHLRIFGGGEDSLVFAFKVMIFIRLHHKLSVK